VIYRSFGKINLYLDVLDRRADGFTNIETIFQSIDLWDELHVEAGGEGIQFTCSEGDLCPPEENLPWNWGRMCPIASWAARRRPPVGARRWKRCLPSGNAGWCWFIPP